MSNPEVQLSKKDIQIMKEELVLPLLNIAELSLFYSSFLESMMDKTSRATMKQSKGWFDPHVQKLKKKKNIDPHVQKLFKKAEYRIGKPH